jgi:hypothetical protein
LKSRVVGLIVLREIIAAGRKRTTNANRPPSDAVLMRDWPDLSEKRNAERKRFLFAEAELALTFCDIARVSPHLHDAARLIQNARKAHDLIVRSQAQLTLTAQETEKLNKLVDELERRLAAIDERYPPECPPNKSE